MDFYWLYELTTGQLFAVVTATVVVFSLAGARALRGRFDQWMGLDSGSNEIVGYFLSFTGAFYGIMLGLVAVGAWETYNSAGEAAKKEAAIAASLYRDVTYLPAPHDGRAQALLRSYAWNVVNLEWPEQQQGNVPYSAREAVEELAAEIYSVEPRTPGQEIVSAEAARQLNSLLEARRYRVEASGEGLPGSLWGVIIAGAVLNIFMTWLLSIKNPKLDLVINLSMASLLGGVLAFVIAMDNPFRGELSVLPESMNNVYTVIMDGGAERPRVN
jgi:Protein of unknown function (DUF4239)